MGSRDARLGLISGAFLEVNSGMIFWPGLGCIWGSNWGSILGSTWGSLLGSLSGSLPGPLPGTFIGDLWVLLGFQGGPFRAHFATPIRAGSGVQIGLNFGIDSGGPFRDQFPAQFWTIFGSKIPNFRKIPQFSVGNELKSLKSCPDLPMLSAGGGGGGGG